MYMFCSIPQFAYSFSNATYDTNISFINKYRFDRLCQFNEKNVFLFLLLLFYLNSSKSYSTANNSNDLVAINLIHT